MLRIENSEESGDNSVEGKRLVSGEKKKVFQNYFKTKSRKVQRIHIKSSEESGDISMEGKRLVSGVKTLRGQTLTANNIAAVCQSTGDTFVIIMIMMIVLNVFRSCYLNRWVCN